MRYKVKPRQSEEFIDSILLNRGVSQEELNNFKVYSDGDIQSPFDLKNMENAVKCFLDFMPIHLAAPAQNKIAFAVHNDFDSNAGNAAFINYCRKAFPGFIPTYFIHIDKGAGFKTILNADDPLIKFIVMIDGGSTQDDARRILEERGVGMIVLDHHMGDDIGAFVVNNQFSPEYNNKALCGAGVVWQFLRALDRTLEKNFSDDDLDIIAMAHIADLMNLKSKETRAIISKGFKKDLSLFATECLGHLEYSMKGMLTPKTVGWYISPLINACSRIGGADEKEMMFKAFLSEENGELISSGKRGANNAKVPLIIEALRIMTNAKSRQQRRTDKYTEFVYQYILENNLNKEPVIIVHVDELDPSDRVLSGLIANKIQDEFKRPCLLVYTKGDMIIGSMRCPEVFVINNFADFINESGFAKAMGHQHAAGVEIYDLEKFEDYCRQKLDGVKIENCYEVDFDFEADEGDLDVLIYEIDSNSDLWGQGLEEPLIAVHNIQLTFDRLFYSNKGKVSVLRFSLPYGVTAIKFGVDESEYLSLKQLMTEFEYPVISLIGTASMNSFQGVDNPQINIKEWQVDNVALDF